ncbi:MAG: phosphate transport regulator [Candidatus Omnitrophica bacterium CG11_big_fil_rev_8_21_14_0_20_45_26]|uniref:Phosphate transport regulator n=1 Tax=Candidatus Abzuiibacterium crystallinum TaxID=1974748 RepID=A0A2H0LMT3_9BACT|nr:MAG: phosphate transport regulator [Candidatus Omnitrophica bacterium CG11_big_fil_rev_8_21_14_0_20_45_26]PIW64135.1 MAG: DUF47 domain-containing protein [Candidatus Omnitrophica bacterium CG12_big_fil_rev_8_21_14_0_65_45_16]
MGFRLIPKEEKFFSMFEQAAQNMERGVLALKSLVTNFDQVQRYASEVKAAEHDGDTQTHEIIAKLDKTFVTPFDREDIHALTSKLDDILDLAWGVADRFVLYQIEQPTPQMVEIIDLLVRSAAELRKAISKATHLKYDNIIEHCVEINNLENQADQIVRHAVADLMNAGGKDPVEVMKLKEIYEHLERAADRCEDVANVLESIALKSS